MLDHKNLNPILPDSKTSDQQIHVFNLSKLIDVEPLTDVLSATNMRSCLIFSRATVAHSGNYVCHVHEGMQDQRDSASVNITVLG